MKTSVSCLIHLHVTLQDTIRLSRYQVPGIQPYTSLSAGSASIEQVLTRISGVRQGGRLPPGEGLPGPF